MGHGAQKRGYGGLIGRLPKFKEPPSGSWRSLEVWCTADSRDSGDRGLMGLSQNQGYHFGAPIIRPAV